MDNINTLIERSLILKAKCEAFENKLDHAILVNTMQAQRLSQYELELSAIKYEHKQIAKKIKRQSWWLKIIKIFK